MKKNRTSSYKYGFASILLGTLLSTSSCKKEVTAPGTVDANNINNVIADNFNLSLFNAVLKQSRQDRTLKEKGPFTVLVPSDAALSTLYSNTTAIASADRAVVSKLAQYHIMDGTYVLSELPFQFNQELRSRTGKLFASRWIKGTDTVLTINGARVLAKNVPASNGLVQVINRVLTPYEHEKLGNAIADEPSLTLFYQALISSGLLETINAGGPYTIFAPNNDAMNGLGYTSVAMVSDTDPATLKKLVNYHVIRDRRFIYDYILGSGSATTMRQNMLDGDPITINLIASSSEPGGFSGITVKGSNNAANIPMAKQDILTGNGVLHIISTGLKPAF